MNNNENAREKIDRVIAGWFNTDYMLFSAWALSEKVECPSQKTIGIDTRTYPTQIRYNPNFINSISSEMLEMVVKSECLKIMLRHPTSRAKTPKEIAGLASQLTVDTLQSDSINKNEEFKHVFPMPEQYDLPDNSNFEFYFYELTDNAEQTMEKIVSEYGPPPPDNTKTDSNEFSEFDSQESAMKEYFNPLSTNNQNWGENELADADLKNLVDQYKGSSSTWGSLTGDIIGQIIAANTPKCSIREILRRFNTSITSTKQLQSRMKPNRRFGLEAPGKLRKYNSKLLIGIDASNSMSDLQISEGFAIVNSTCRHAQIDYLLFDTEIKQIVKKQKRAKKVFKVVGRGGTDVTKVLAYADKHCYDGLVIFSDMEFSENIRRPKTRVMWIGTDKNSKKPVPWGHFSTLNKF